MPDLLLLQDIARLVGESHSLEGILYRVVRLVAERMDSEVCTIYLLDPSGESLTLAAAHGLKPDAVGHATLERGEGVTWRILDRMKPLVIDDAQQDEHFLLLPEVGEEELHSLLGVPLRMRGKAIGTLAVQTRKTREFHEDEVRGLSAIASQIAPVVENARLLQGQESDATDGDDGEMRRAIGTSCSTGVVVGKARKVEDRSASDAPKDASIDAAFEASHDELNAMQEWLRDHNADEAALVFSVQLMLLDDPSFRSRIDDAMAGGAAPGAAVAEVRDHVMARFARMKDSYFRERTADVADLTNRVLRHLGGGSKQDPRSVKGRVAIIGDLTPSRLVSLCAEGAVAVLAGGGGATSHAALLARSLDLPLIVGLGDFVHTVREGDPLLVDASAGEVIVDPPEELVTETLRFATTLAEALHRFAGEHVGRSGRIRYESNVSLWGDAVRAKNHGAQGVGLYRTEFAFLMRPDLPSEEEQVENYRRIVDHVAPMPVTFRLLDAGGDKLVPSLGLTAEPNPFLGYRSTRLLLDHPDVLRGQVRSILAALDGREGRVLVPMVASVEDFRAVRCLLEDADLLPKELGAMIELPSAVLGAEELAREADFLSIGTNDLTQHLLGVDRTNARVTRYFDFCHPSLLRAITMVAAAAKNHGTPVCVCGEMASNPLFLPVWVALGVERLSVHAKRIPPLTALEAQFVTEEAEALTRDILALDSSSEIRRRLESVAASEVVDYLHGSERA